MRIVIDMQGAQADSHLGGNSAYIIAFVEAVVGNSGDHEIILALSGLFSESIEPIKDVFDELLPQENIVIWHAPGPVRMDEPGNISRSQTAEVLREAFFASLKPDVIHITDFFQGYTEEAVTSIGRFDVSTPVTITKFESIEVTEYKAQAQWLAYKHQMCANAAATISLNYEAGIVQIQKPGPHSTISQKHKLTASHDFLASIAFGLWSELVAVKDIVKVPNLTRRKPRLAFVSPLPPLHTGIAYYSADLIPALALHYEIELVIAQELEDDSWFKQYATARSVEWFKSNAKHLDYVLYHFGNSLFHEHMLDLYEAIPGTVVLHDFYLGHLLRASEYNSHPNVWRYSLYSSHGYVALSESYVDPEAATLKYPCNRSILELSRGLIVHSEFAKTLAQQWYGHKISQNIAVIPLLRKPAEQVDRYLARTTLNLNTHDFIVCSFGKIGEAKQNHRLLDVWLKSLSHKDNSRLIFVGEYGSDQYSLDLIKRIHECTPNAQIEITGFVPPDLYAKYLAAADIGVQLRTNSRGETSAAILDCMNYGLPVITNSHGSAAEINSDLVWMIPDAFTDDELTAAIDYCRTSRTNCFETAQRAREYVHEYHSPEIVAKKYAQVIESPCSQSANDVSALIENLAENLVSAYPDTTLLELAEAIAKNHPSPLRAKCLYVDVSIISRNDLRTGIQRVTRALTLSLLKTPPLGYKVEPVYLCDKGGFWNYRFASRFTSETLGFSAELMQDKSVEPQNGDILLLLDLSGTMFVNASESGLYKLWRAVGVKCVSTVYDLLPVLMPSVFPRDACQAHAKWLESTTALDGVVCISKAVACDFNKWMNDNIPRLSTPRNFFVEWFHLGADIVNSNPDMGVPVDAENLLASMRKCPTFLMVGTIEPRKGHLQCLEAFDELWDRQTDINLVIVGKEGWKGWVPNHLRRNIPEIVTRLRSHPELGKHLFWLEGISDEYLEKIYATSTCLIAASFGEGFGLPLIEAAQHGLPIIARDIPVFREVAGKHAFYFQADNPQQLARSIDSWLSLYSSHLHPKSDKMYWITWQKSAGQLVNILTSRRG